MDGMNMKEQRADLGLTQAALATFLGYKAPARISEFENEHRPIPRYIALVMEALASGWRPADWEEGEA
jgi:transcriptional regulator with XRE-family HTH domain